MTQSPIRFTGLFSGMDTQGMVQQLMRAESMRMDRLTRRRQTLAWRQEDMRSTINLLNTFRDARATPETVGSLTHFNTFNTMRSTVTQNGTINPPGISVVTGGAAQAGSLRVTVNAVAQGDLVRSTQFQGTAVGATGEVVNPNTIIRDVLPDVTYNIHRFEHLAGANINGNASLRYDLSRLSTTPPLPQWLGQVDIVRNGNEIEYLRDSQGRVFERYFVFNDPDDPSASGVFVLRNVTGVIVTTISADDLTAIESAIEAAHNVNFDDDNFDPATDIRMTRAFRFYQLTDADGRNRYDLTRIVPVIPSLPTTFLDVGIRRDDGGYITELRDSGNRLFTRYEVAPGEFILRHETAPGVFEVIIATDLTAIEAAISDAHNTGFGHQDFDPLNDIRLTRTHDANTTTAMINGVEVRFSLDMTIGAFMNTVNAAGAGVRMTWDGARGQFFLQATGTGDDTDRVNNSTVFTGEDDFGLLAFLGFDNIRGGAFDGSFGDTLDPASRYAREAQQAKIEVRDGSPGFLEFHSQTNSFTDILPGISINLTQQAAPTNGSPQEFTIETRGNTEDTINIIRGFVEDFNNLLRALNALHSTPRPRGTGGNFFDPLTDMERAEMSDREIERWEEQARIGLLHRDNNIRSIHNQLRNAMFQDVQWVNPHTGQRETVNLTEFMPLRDAGTREDRNIGLIDLDWSRLQQALEENPDRVRALFARDIHEIDTGLQASNPANRAARAPQVGLARRLRDIVETATAFDGTLSRIAGHGVNIDENPMSRQIRTYDQRLEQMQRWLLRREQHFFNMFARMEQVMATANAQMDSLWMMGGM